MKENIRIKKFPNGITLYLDPEVSFEVLLEELAVRFQQSRKFFSDAKLALGLEGRNITEDEERLIINTIHSNSDVTIICIMGKNEETNRNFVKAVQRVEKQHMNNSGRFYRGTLNNSQKIEVESSIVILGDVYPGSCVTAAKDIIIIGGLYGEAHAGTDGEEGHYVAALEMSPEKIMIGDFQYIHKKKKRWLLKEKVQPKIAFVKEKHIAVEPITKELPELLPF